MKFFAIRILLLLQPFSTFSQETDTIKPKAYENFFGSDCMEEIVVRDFGEKNQCILNKGENKIYRKKNDKIKWSIDLNKEFESNTIESECIFPRNHSKVIRKAIVIISFYDKGKHWALFMKFSSGKIIKTVEQNY